MKHFQILGLGSETLVVKMRVDNDGSKSWFRNMHRVFVLNRLTLSAVDPDTGLRDLTAEFDPGNGMSVVYDVGDIPAPPERGDC